MKKGDKEEDNRCIANKEIERMKEGDRRKREKDIGLGGERKKWLQERAGLFICRHPRQAPGRVGEQSHGL